MADLSIMGFLNEETQQETEYNLKDAQARSDISTINSKIPSNASSNNKLATISDVSAAYKPKGNATLAKLPSLTVEHLNWVYNMTEDFLTTSDFAEGAGKLVKAGNEVGIIDVSATSTPSYKYTVLGGFVDTSSLQPKELDTPVEVGGVNRTTVETALSALANDKEDTIFAASPLVKEYDEIMMQEILRLNQDDIPTANSNNPVKSSGIKSALDATVDLLKDTTGWIGGNELPNYRESISPTGVTYTRNADMSVTANGTQDGTGDGADWTPIIAPTDNNSRFKISDFPKFSNSVYSVGVAVDANITVGIWYYNSSKQYIGLQTISSGEQYLLINPIQNAVYFTPYFRVNKNKTVSNLTFYPMIIDKELFALNPSYRPYHASVEEVKADKTEVQTTLSLLDNTVGWVGVNKLNAKFKNSDAPNIVVTPHYDAKGLLEYVNLNGSNSSGEKILIQFAARLDGDLILPNGNYKFSLGVFDENIKMQVGRNSSGPTSGSFVLLATSSYGDSDLSFTQDQPYGLTVQILAKANSTFDNVKVYPMVCTAEQYALSPTYEPYHESVEDWYWSENAKTGVHNFLNTEKFETGTKDGITSTVRADKGISLTGTPTIQSGTIFFRNYGTVLKAGTYKYKLNKNPKDSCIVGVNDSPSGLGNYKILATLTTNMTEISFTVTDEDLASKPYVFCELGVHYSAGTIDEVYYPQILLNEDTFGGFMPFSMTNTQLTEKVTVKSDSITSSFTANGDVANGLKKIGEIVFIDAAYKEVTASQWDVIATIPAGFRPKTPCRLLDGFGKKSLVINANGDIQAAESISNTYVYIHGSWVVS